MIRIQLAEPEHADGIMQVCQNAQWATYNHLCDKAYIERTIKDFYNRERILKEIRETGNKWGGWIVALSGLEVVGAIGGGMTADNTGEVFVLYLDPDRRNEGIGTKLLEALTRQQKKLGAQEQWVSVMRDNRKGIPFYEARGFIYRHDQKAYESKEDENYVSHRYSRAI